MKQPVILLVADEQADVLRHEFARYEHDYRIEVATGLAESVTVATRLASTQVPIALIVARYDLPDAPGLVTLDCLHAISATSRRVILLGWNQFRSVRDVVREALQAGRADASLTLPRGVRDEEFHTAITELLSDWGWSSSTPVAEVVRIIADDVDAHTAQLRDFLDRQGIPTRTYRRDSEPGQEGLDEWRQLHPGAEPDLPLVTSAMTEPLARPSLAQIGAIFRPRTFDDSVSDVTIVGAGPAGLAAAVYGASEGLRTRVFDAYAIGGQAGSSSMIRNYLGFPRGISGMRLAQRASTQANRFGAELYSGCVVQKMTIGAGDEPHTLHLDDGTPVRTRAVVIATGVKYRRLGVDSVEEFLGLGVHYGAATSVSRECLGTDVHVVGGGNSAGQAAMHLSRYARSVTIIVRRSGLEETMSDYLIREIEANPRIRLCPGAEVSDAGGVGRLGWVTIRDIASGAEQQVESGGLFLLIGAKPCVEWLPPEVLRDDKGFVLTGRDVPMDTWVDNCPPPPLATTVPGVFAAGDIRSGSMKRVASAAGEGAAAVPLIHAFLAPQS